MSNSIFVLPLFLFDTRLWKTKHPQKRFQNFRQSWVLSTDRIKIHQSQPLVWPSDLLYVMLAGCDWWISIRAVDNTQDWQTFWKCFRGCFVFQSRAWTKTVVIVGSYYNWWIVSSLILFRPSHPIQILWILLNFIFMWVGHDWALNFSLPD